MIGAALIMAGSEPLTIAGIVCAGLGFANIWPALFSITVEHRPERANELSGLMCMAISGGAIVPLVMARLADAKWGAMAFVVPAACFTYLTLISLWQKQPRPSTAS
jgi:fucose permease